MICCDDLIHPFQNDQGVSQRQRVIDDLLSGSAKIDGRRMAELLDYFVQLSHHINYYDSNLLISDWSEFFKDSNPFILASIIKCNKEKIQRRFDKLNRLFDKYPSRQSLQLLIHFVYFNSIYRVNLWHTQLKASELKAEIFVEKLIKDKLKKHVKTFICLTNNAVQKHQIRKLDFTALRQNDVWGLTSSDWSNMSCFNSTAATKRKRLIALRNKIAELFPIMLNSLSLAGTAAELSMNESLLPIKEEFQKNHPPHLALLFAFLKLFSHLQTDLNGYTKKHLDFFYQKVLQLKPREATPDKAHILFEIQKELDKYLVKKDVQVKDGKDVKKAEINFATTDEIVVNKTTVGDVKTLFLNNRTIHDSYYLEGAYIAPDARKSDGMKIDFTDDPKNWPTLGAKYSKYVDPEKKTQRAYPNARLGFILSSPVLQLNEGTRTINIQLACIIDKTICEAADTNKPISDPCCGTPKTQDKPEDPCRDTDILPIDPAGFIDETNEVTFNDNQYGVEPNIKIINRALKQTYCFISQQLLEEAEKKGISKNIVTLIKKKFLLDHCHTAFCCAGAERYLPDSFVRRGGWRHFINKYKREQRISDADEKILLEIFPSRRPFKIQFSGEKEWIEPKPSGITDISMTKAGSGFLLNITVELQPDQPAVTFYNKEKLKEDFGTESPVVKIELDNELGLRMNKRLRKLFKLEGPGGDQCCLYQKVPNCLDRLSFYHFFKYVRVVGNLDAPPVNDTNATKISVKVCGLKNFVVQNEASLQDVNAPIYVFGATPHIGEHFYIGCEEIFLKKWNNISINHTWKDVPPISKLDPPLFGTRFRAYYNGYQDFFITSAVEQNIVLDENFQMEVAIRQDGDWRPWKYSLACEGGTDPKTLLFQPMPPTSLCLEDKNYDYQYVINRVADFPAAPNNLDFPKEKFSYKGLKKFTVDARQSFIRITLKCQDFQHDKYPFILARQMAALGKLPDILDGAVYFGVQLGIPPHFTNLNIPVILKQLEDTAGLSQIPGFDLDQNTIDLVNNIIKVADPANRADGDIQNIWNEVFTIKDPTLAEPGLPVPIFSTAPFATNPALLDHSHSFYNDTLHKIVKWLRDQAATIHNIQDKGVVIPNPPWVPIMSSICLDYDAVAPIGDIDLIHLHPYEGTYEEKELELKPSLFPTFCDEGNLFIGLKDLVPGSNLNMLFQLAEATANSESERDDLKWYYLDNNQWKSLRKGFEVLDDGTDGLTTSGIVKFATPENMTKENTIMPKGMHWIKASMATRTNSVSETIGIHPQAIQVEFTNTDENDKLRLDKPLVAKSLSKLTDADANIKKVEQPYDSFGGREPEIEKHYYLRVSEILRHKGRAIQKWDYEHIVLESFPQVYRTKCINHSYALNAYEYINDFPMAPGYVLLAVIPDLTKLEAGNSFEPKAPVSLIEEITKYVRKRTSPFVRFRVMNPRYEKVDFCLKVKLCKGRDENYYKEKLAADLRNFLAPWAVGDYDKLKFGQCVNRSDLLRFLEALDYLDYVIELKMKHERDVVPDAIRQEICPKTPRSILFAGEIDICIPADACDGWEECPDAGGKSKCCDHDPIPVLDYCHDKKYKK